MMMIRRSPDVHVRHQISRNVNDLQNKSDYIVGKLIEYLIVIIIKILAKESSRARNFASLFAFALLFAPFPILRSLVPGLRYQFQNGSKLSTENTCKRFRPLVDNIRDTDSSP